MSRVTSQGGNTYNPNRSTSRVSSNPGINAVANTHRVRLPDLNSKNLDRFNEQQGVFNANDNISRFTQAPAEVIEKIFGLGKVGTHHSAPIVESTSRTHQRRPAVVSQPKDESHMAASGVASEGANNSGVSSNQTK
ncbi:uncharacterized protein AB675_11338 [Cyphellophora attinorum]|uniref:Uncharacterized protein n=1 Tax=Cyphellophora attinorum TaxID=1664694 RepID=A0A0N0NM16_9EURO|nr:uncharacterized protein AB675_11338 [Phialophora attinorum]KPI39941.1 hypothetical protein AB675_11338 [Phialophora attinorum]